VAEIMARFRNKEMPKLAKSAGSAVAM